MKKRLSSGVRNEGCLVMRRVNSRVCAFNTEDGFYSYVVSAKEMGNYFFFLESCKGRKLNIPFGSRYKTERVGDLNEGEVKKLLEQRLEKRAREVLFKEDGRYSLRRDYPFS